MSIFTFKRFCRLSNPKTPLETLVALYIGFVTKAPQAFIFKTLPPPACVICAKAPPIAISRNSTHKILQLFQKKKIFAFWPYFDFCAFSLIRCAKSENGLHDFQHCQIIKVLFLFCLKHSPIRGITFSLYLQNLNINTNFKF